MRRFSVPFLALVVLISSLNIQDVRARNLDFSLLGGISAASEKHSGVGLQGGARFDFALGNRLWLDLTPSATYFTESFYLVDVPLVLSGEIRLSHGRFIRLGGGLGAAISNLPEWLNRNRALTAQISARWFDQNLFNARLVPELLLSRAATSTGNTEFLTLRLAFRFGG